MSIRRETLGRRLALLSLVALPLAGVALSQEEATPERDSSRGPVATAGKKPPVERMSAKSRRERVASAVLMLAGLICTGVVLVAFVLIWGRRVRRLAAQGLQKCAPVDELWFLKQRSAARDQPDAPRASPPENGGPPGPGGAA